MGKGATHILILDVFLCNSDFDMKINCQALPFQRLIAYDHFSEEMLKTCLNYSCCLFPKFSLNVSFM